MANEGKVRVRYLMVKHGEVVPYDGTDMGKLVFRDDPLWLMYRETQRRNLRFFMWSMVFISCAHFVFFLLIDEPFALVYSIVFALIAISQRLTTIRWEDLIHGIGVHKRGFNIPMMGLLGPQQVFVPLSEVEGWERGWRGLAMRTGFGRRRWLLLYKAMGEKGIDKAQRMLETRHIVPGIRRSPWSRGRRPKLVVYTEAGRLDEE